MLKNFKQSANSRKPRVTLTELSHPPDLGRPLIHSGKIAKRVNGIENAREYENMARMGFVICPPAASTTTFPTIGSVQEKETNTSVVAIKKIPINPPFSA